MHLQEQAAFYLSFCGMIADLFQVLFASGE